MMSQAPPNINCNCCIIIIVTFSNFQSKDFDTF